METRVFLGSEWGELADELSRRLAEDVGDPFEPRIVAVPNNGGPLVRWLRDRLASRLGVIANVRFVGLEGALLERAGTAREPRSFTGGPVDTLAVLSALPSEGSDPRFADVEAYLAEDIAQGVRGLRSVAFAAEVASSLALFERYRADDPGRLPAYQRAVFEAVLQDRAARPLGARLAGPQEPLPPAGVRSSLHVFGLAHASPTLVEALARSSGPGGRPPFVYALDGGPLDREPANALLRTNGRPFRAAAKAARDVGLVIDRRPLATGTAVGARTTLGQLQRALADDLPLPPSSHPGEARRPDTSLQIHGGHGPRRQVEILHDVLLALFEADPTLRPRDVRILTPSPELYEPLVEAIFAGGNPHTGHAWPLRAHAGQSAPGDEHLAILSAVVALVQGRFELASVLSLLGRPRVRARFGLSAEDVGVVGGWLEETRVSWGRDAAHRAACLGVDDHAHPLSQLDEGTWTFGLGRLALAVTSLPESGLFHGRAAANDIEGSAARIAGGALAMIRGLETLVVRLAAPATITAWVERATEILATLVADDDGDEDEATEDGGAEARRLLSALSSAAATREVSLDAPGFGALVTSLRAGPIRLRSGRPNDLQIAPLSAENALPARIIALLGLDEDVFPRRDRPSSVSSLATETRALDPDPRADDRAAFLQALRSAGEAVVITAGLRDTRTNAARPLATPLAELVETLSGDDASTSSSAWVVHHPLQPFGEPSLTARHEALPFSHDPRALAIAEALRANVREQHGPFREITHGLASLPDYPEGDISLEELGQLFRDPVRALLSLRLGTTLETGAITRDRREPVELSGLELWQLREQYLAAAKELTEAQIRETLRASGQLPLGGAGDAVLDDLGAELLALTTAFGEAVRAARESQRERVETPLLAVVPPRRIVGTVRGRAGDRLIAARLSRPEKPSQLLGAYLSLLVANTAEGGPRSAELLGLDDKRVAKKIMLHVPATPEARTAQLVRYVDIFLQGMKRPLPFFEKTSFALAQVFDEAGIGEGWAEITGEIADRAREAAWGAWARQNGDREEIGERSSASARAAFPMRPPFLDPDDPRRLDAGFVALAEAVYAPVLAAIERAPRSAPSQPGATR